QRVLAAEAVAEGRAALAEGDVHRALTRLVNAVAHDPLANDARLVLQELLNGPLGAGAPADGAPRAFAVLAFADELLERPELLGAYCEVFGPADDVTLIIYAPGWDAEQAGTRLPALLTAAGRADRPGPDIRAMPVAHPDPVQEEGLARAVRAVLTETRPQDAFAGVPAFTAATAPQLRVLADLLRAPAA
ncbi:MAG: hypothetical protein QOK49_2756, partial [Baekduia sp.]|nr:hypothetical protein [Baekduia sp.]